MVVFRKKQESIVLRKSLLFWFVWCVVLLPVQALSKSRKAIARQEKTVSCVLYSTKQEDKYLLIRSFSTNKIGISCKNHVFVYTCFQGKDAWFRLVDPRLELRESCDPDGRYKVWEKMWVIYSATTSAPFGKAEEESEVVTIPIPEQVFVEFYCEFS